MFSAKTAVVRGIAGDKVAQDALAPLFLCYDETGNKDWTGTNCIYMPYMIK